MAQHIKIVAVLHIILGALTVLGALLLVAIFGGVATLIGASGDRDALTAIPILGGIGSILFVILLAVGLPGIIAGIGLLKFRPWGRILGIIISGIDLVHVPFGTALGIYGLWALLSNEAEALFREPPVQPVRV